MRYLRTGESEVHGVAAGAMAGVVHSGLAKLPDADVQALATYFADGIVFGLENAPEAFIGLLQGKNFGKLVIQLAHE